MESRRPAQIQVDRARLLEHLHRLQGPRHAIESPEGLGRAQAYLVDQMRRAGLEVRLDEFLYAGREFLTERPFANVVARPPGSGEQPRVIIGAHFDTVAGTPGADDNASGVAVMLEASRILMARRPDAPVEFVGFNLEELSLVGSTHYAVTLKNRGAAVRGMVSLEMVGFTETEGRQRYPGILGQLYPPVGNFIGLISNQGSAALLKPLERGMRSVEGLPVETITVPGNGELLTECRRSDHAPFWDAGFPAVLITDTAFLRNPHYHLPSDTIETLDLGFMEQVCRGLVAALEQSASG
ncbi:MAG: M28 family peptidase [Candidatus Omnitrophica bacterium]|nr:M28 family peptidase [Candidatus Omnitrophota bacterium]